MKRIHLDAEHVNEDIKPGMVLHDEYTPETFMVTHTTVRENSVMVYGYRFHYSPTAGQAVPVEFSSLYLYGEDGLWNLNAD